MTDLHLVVGGLLTRDPVLAPLLLNHAAALQWAQAPAPTSIAPSWAADERPGAPDGGELLTVEAHVSRDTPHPHRCLDTVLDTVHAVLTRGPIRVERLADADVPDIGGGTVSRAATWALTLAAPDVLDRPATGYRSSGAASSNR
ncbi:hypothetical protein SAMN05660642_02532 [Geodermatophilus siccatus]|uniref:Uncharacterized protein n=1 Tax=Geodermatophilus siccatus TaxID=1137991 RepID=A0A1G9TJS9_9ACTN|nr:hypothetical protein [Geodermatophilus siccatus]SDM47798.1 hypothetical protein SAMN05660642_02532 [Geodermatophilus siccatus]